jgi:hypothetical protein
MRQGNLASARKTLRRFALTRKFCQPFGTLPEDTRSVWQRGGDTPMATYSIIRIFEVPADTQQQATDRMLEALVLHVEKDFHVKDIIREKVEKGAKPGKWNAVHLAPPAGWLTLAWRQLTGK